jgi:PAS domain S-box-containing protein
MLEHKRNSRQKAQAADADRSGVVPSAAADRQRWQARLLEQAHDAMFVWELVGPIVYWNRGAELLYGYSAEEAVGQVSHDLLRTVFPLPTTEAFEALLGREGEWTGELTHTTRDGRSVVVLSRLQVLREPDGPALVLETARDITDRKRLEEELAERVTEVEAIQAVTDVALSHLALDALLRELLERLRTVLAVDNVAILLPSGDESSADAPGPGASLDRELRIYQARGPEEEVAGQVRVPIGQGVAGRIAATRQPLIIDDLSQAKPVNPFLRERLRSLMGVPLLVEDRLVGVMHAATATHHHFTDRDVRLLQLVGDRIALAIDRAQLHRAAQEARQEAEARSNQQAAMIEALADGMVIFNTGGGLVQMNSAARDLLGQAVQPEYLGLPGRAEDSRMQVRDERGRVLPVTEWPVRRVLAGEVLHSAQAVDLLLHTRDSREMQVSVTGAPIRDAVGQIVGAVCIFRDVTERRYLERRTQQALDSLLAMARTLVDPVTTDASVSLPVPQSARDVAQRLAELTRSVLSCRRVGILAIEPGTRLQRPLAVVGLAPEQEQQWWAEQEQQEAHLGEGTDPDVLVRFTAGEPLILDMTAPPYVELPNPYGITTVLVAPMRVGAEVVGLLSLDFGGERHAFTEGELALAEAVAQLAALAIERERLLAEREEARAKELALLTVNQRMDEFLSMAAHDLKSPVASGKLNAQVAARQLQRAAALPEAAQLGTTTPFTQAQHSLEAVNHSMDRLARLVDRLLDVSRVRTGKLEVFLQPCPLDNLVRECVEEQRLLAPSRTIRLQLPPAGPVRALADADRIDQVITNFLTNALRYAPEDRPITVTLAVEDASARVSVRDEGPGIPVEEQQRIWAQFEQAASSSSQRRREEPGAAPPSHQTGLGLGLYISREIIERHGGQVGVDSAAGRGATFWFTLPLLPTDHQTEP